jgi:putative ABC transport system permease protein
MLQSAVNWLRVDLGLRADRVLSASLALRQRAYPDVASRLTFYERAIQRLGVIAGVESVAITNRWPLQQPRLQSVEADDGDTRRVARAGMTSVTSEYFATLHVSITAGRSFTSSDREGGDPVAIVSETLARQLWATRQPIGSRVVISVASDARESNQQAPIARRVVGVVRNVRQTPADEDLADLYLPLLQEPGRFGWVYLRTAGEPRNWLSSIRSAFKDIDPHISIDTARPLQSAVDEQASRPQFLAWLLGGFALIAGLLALIGVYGVIAYAVRQREREIAVRIAVGAEPGMITKLFLRQGGTVLLAGLVVGLIGALVAGRTIESQLFNVKPTEPLTLAMTVAAFAAAGMVAIWWPARRAAHTSPAAALKDE